MTALSFLDFSLTNLCPCQSGKNYGECCHPFHFAEKNPQNAEQLMRSRYSAFVLQHIDYIVETTVPTQQKLLDRSALQEWAETTNWQGLEVIKHTPAISKTHSFVEFKAFFMHDQQKQAHHELSLFVNIQKRWYFVDPTVPLPSNKQNCVCGSEKKFKHCCGQFLGV